MAREELDLSPFAKVMREKGRPHSRPLDFPGLEGVRVVLWNPSDDEVAQADAEARQWLTAKPPAGLGLDATQLGLAVEGNLHEAEYQRRLLAVVLRDAKDPGTPFASVDDLREWCTPDQRQVLMQHLAAFANERDPGRKLAPDATDEEVTGLIRALKEQGEEVVSDYLTSCGSDTLRSIALSLARALPPPTPPSSSGT